SSGPTTLLVDETVHEERGDSMERVATTAASLDAVQDSGSGPRRQYTILGDRPAQTRLKIMKLMEICTKLSDMVLPLENVKTAQDLEITILKKRVKKLEKKKKAQTPQLKRSALITTAGVSVSTAEPITPPITAAVIEDEDLIIAQTFMEIKKPSESGTRKAVPPSQHDLNDNGKVKMIKPEKPLNKKDQIKFDEEVAKRLAEELEAELEEEERVTIQREEDMLFDKEMKRVNLFVPIDSEVVEGSRKKTERSSNETVSKVQEIKASVSSSGDKDSSGYESEKRNTHCLEYQSNTSGNDSSRSRNECNERNTFRDDTDTRPSYDIEPIDEVSYTDEYNVFVVETQHFEQPETMNDTSLIEKVDSNTTPDSSDLCNNEFKDDQNDDDHYNTPCFRVIDVVNKFTMYLLYYTHLLLNRKR
ncbi:hypothetical protein Tco_0882957, partial [Tanacetum coccineum]